MLNLFSHVWHFVTTNPMAALSMGFFTQEFWSRLPFSPPGDLPDTEMELKYATAPTLQVDSLLLSQNICCIQETNFNYEDS